MRTHPSHSWKYSEKYCRAVKFLDDTPDFEWRNSSVPEDDAFENMSINELKQQLTRQIAYAQCV